VVISGRSGHSWWWAEVWHLDVQVPAGLTPIPPSFPVINKYKRRRFQKTKNLLTGEADPEMIKVSGSGSAACGDGATEP
jgi:hypothetical protein